MCFTRICHHFLNPSVLRALKKHKFFVRLSSLLIQCKNMINKTTKMKGYDTYREKYKNERVLTAHPSNQLIQSVQGLPRSHMYGPCPGMALS